jgi:PKD repeat protein
MAILFAWGIAWVASAQTRTIRVVAYNIQDDISGATTPLPGLITPSSGGSVTNGGVLEGIGEEILGNDPAQPIDILALQETTSNTTTVQPIVDGLNTFYSVHTISARYAMSTYQGTQSGGNTGGNGPNAMVYNTNTVQLVASVGVGTPQGASNGEYRQVVRYEFAPAGVTPTTNNEFYVYVSHYKSGTTSSDVTARNGEAGIIRADAATLPSNARILYTGDFNASTSGEAMYQTLIAAGANQGYDVLNPAGLTTNDWGSSTTSTSILAALSESATNLRFRDDYQMMTSNVLFGVAGGLAYVPGTYHVFGNNGTTPYNGTVNSGSDTALNNDLTTNVTGITATQLYQYLTTGSDHLPAVADYTIPVSAPASLQSIQTVFVIPMENLNWSSILSNSSAPYINNTLLPMASHAEQYYNPPGNHPSLPNYFWLEAGTNFGFSSDVLPAAGHQGTTNHLVTLLKNAGISWRSYDEDINGLLCPLVNTNSYVPRHNPFVYFDDVTCNTNPSCAYCIAHDVAYSTLAGDLQNNSVARYNWVVPNLCDDMHNSCSPTNNNLAQGDGWLSRELPKILNSQAYSNNGAIFIVWDEGAGTSDGPIGMIVISPLAKGGGYSNTVHYTHSSTLKTFQEIFNVGPLLGDAGNATDLGDLFSLTAAQLSVVPGTGLTSIGSVAGPFDPVSQTYTLSNSGGATLSWTASKTAPWLTLSATAGTLAPASNATVIASINGNANSLTPNSYFDTISFTNTTNGAGNDTRPVSLTVTNGAAQLTVTPPSGLTSSGPLGGPFSPVSQTYTLSNVGGATLTWTAGNSANWLTLSATAGTLAPGSNTIVTTSINGNANSLTPNSYSDTVSFTNVTNDVGDTTRAVSLTVNGAALTVSPALGLTSSGPQGGAFNPGSQVYALTNSGGATLSWTVSKTASWVTLSATAGSLAVGTSTNVTVSINGNANSLAAGGHSDTVGFTNVTNGTGNTTRAVSLTVNSTNVSNFGFYDDFSTFTSGNLVGQTNWTQLGAVSSLLLQVSGGKVGIPAGQTADNQDAYKNFTLTNGAVFYGITVTVTNAVTNASPSYFTALYTGNDAGGFANYRMTAKAGDTARTNYVLGVRVTGQTGDPYTFGTTALSTGTQYRVIVQALQAPSGGTNVIVYVNPTSSNLGAQTQYANNPVQSGTPPTSVGSFVISQFGTTSASTGPTDGALIGKVVVADNFATVYNDLLGAVPPVASFTASPTSGTEPLGVTFADTSTGTPPISLFWDLGDTTTTNTAGGASFGHTYQAGTYSVTLTASNATGISTIVSNNLITVITALQTWQLQYFGCTNCPQAAPDADPFGKGISNTNQFLMGLNPTNPASVFRIISVSPSGNDMVVTWQTSGGDPSGLFGSGKTNVLEAAPGQPDGSYSNNFASTVATVVITTLGDVVTNAVDSGGATNVPSWYYRIRFISP